MTKDKALKLALEALEGVLDDAPKVFDASISGGTYEVIQCRDAITAIKEALAQPAQEPVAWATKFDAVPLYAAPPQRPWVGLEAEDRLCAKYMQDAPDGIEAVIDYIEAALRSKNNG